MANYANLPKIKQMHQDEGKRCPSYDRAQRKGRAGTVHFILINSKRCFLALF